MPQRVVLAIMGFLAIVNAYTMRICLSVAITEMVKKTVSNSSIESGDSCPVIDDGSDDGGLTGVGTFEWSEQLQGLILSSFYWGYVITHLPGGYLAEKFGGKYTLSLGILSTAVFTLLTPVVVEWGEFRRAWVSICGLSLLNYEISFRRPHLVDRPSSAGRSRRGNDLPCT